MFAPVTLARAASQASVKRLSSYRREGGLATSTPSKLDQETHGAFPFPNVGATSGHETDSDGEDTDALEGHFGQASEEVEDPRAPLLERRGRSTTRPGGLHRRETSTYEIAFKGIAQEEGDGRAEVVGWQGLVARGVFFVLGACILLAWNSEIVSAGYIGSRLKGSVFQYSYASFVALTFTVGNVVFLAHATATQHGSDIGKRILYSIAVLTVTVVLFVVSTQIDQIDQTLFFFVLILCTLILSASASYLQNAVVALSARFGPQYLQSILSGQGAVGLAVSMIQFSAAYTAFKPTSTLPALSDLPDQLPFVDSPLARAAPIPDEGVRSSAFSFFITITIFSVISFISYLVIIRLPLYRQIMRSSAAGDLETSSTAEPTKTPSIRAVERKIRKLGISMLVVFMVTLSVFPSITATITSVNEGPERPGEGLGDTLSEAQLFIPIAFMMFAAGDWLGRVLPQIEWLVFTNWKALMSLSFARVVFIPLFLMCNTAASTSAPLINSDFLFLGIMLLFSTTNGYFSTLIMLACVVEPSLEEHEIDIAATCMVFYLTSGLAIGSFISFPVRAALCSCNPFT